eukprot:TRINITY_DN11799_c0_g1_i3.p1 TRINITY_DN11799_c0_g1~~TRINITY_DN11799_c0_g1_i3.p1  ORF type:complete len:363 (-),score=48.50 TRINITY_DN11799_c0_g1_i3:1002-2090(-)
MTRSHEAWYGQWQTEIVSEGPFARLGQTNKNDDHVPENGKLETLQNGYYDTKRTESDEQPSVTFRYSVDVNNLDFSYPGIDGRPLQGVPPLIKGMNLQLSPGDRCLLVGPNGAGKTTLLKVLGGKHMVPKDEVKILGQPPFHATGLTTGGQLAYVGGNWERDIAFAGYSIPLQGDFPASQILNSIQGVSEERRQKIIKVLDINPNWRMHLVSDGQRRRVQIAVGLLRPCSVLLLDEITVDLDVLGRADLMRFLKEECDRRGATIIYATHIFDGLEFWPTHVAYVADGQLQLFKPVDQLPQIKEGRLLEMIVEWLREEKQNRKVRDAQKCARKEDFSYQWNNGWAPGRLESTLKHSSNTVMRM